MSSTTEIKLNKEQANYGIDELKQCQRELYEADKLFYKGIMALASAKGMDLVLREDAAINLYMPEKIVIECRDEIATLIEEISSKIALVEDFNEEPKEGTETVQYRKTDETIDKKIAVPLKPGIAEETVEAPGAQPLYGVPTPGKIGPIQGGTTGPIQALYAPPGVVEPIEGIPGAQPLYGVPTPGGPIQGGVTGPIQALYAPPPGPGVVGPIEGVQPMYGVPTPGVIGPIEGGITGPIQALYAPPPGVIGPVEPVVQPMYGVITPTPPTIVDPIVQPMYGVITPTPPTIVDPIVQPMYGVITPTPPTIVDPIVQPMYGVITPTPPTIIEPIGGGGGTVPGPVQALYAPPGIIDGVGGIPDPIPTPTPSIPEYETIPNTGIPGVIEKNYVSKHPRLIGGLAATIGLFGIPTMLSDDFDEEEEKRMNGKED